MYMSVCLNVHMCTTCVQYPQWHRDVLASFKLKLEMVVSYSGSCGRAASVFSPRVISLYLMLYILDYCIIVDSMRWPESITLCQRFQIESELGNDVFTLGR